jgi:DNA-binding NarL/FixJ family response regulator
LAVTPFKITGNVLQTHHNRRVKVLVIESNLMWSSKLKMSLLALGHEPILSGGWPSQDVQADLAIVNLSQPDPAPADLIETLRSRHIKVVAHAGHKEKQLHELGMKAGADVLATNGELSSKLKDILERAFQ